MSVSQELENMRNGLEGESRSLSEERKLLEDKAKTLRDKVAIEELRKNNAATRDAITQLKAEVKELEQWLSGAEAPAPSQQPQETVTESVVVLDPEVSPQPQQPNDKKKEEKRRRFF